MKSTLILYVALFFSGWILSLTRVGWIARLLVLFSVPLGALIGGGGGYAIGRFVVYPFDGGPESQHNWIGWMVAGMLGAAIGAIVLPTIALALTERKKRT